MKKAKLVDAKSEGRTFATSLANTGLPQRATLEESIINLATVAGLKKVARRLSARGALFYSVDGHSYQSASNTILALSRQLIAIMR